MLEMDKRAPREAVADATPQDVATLLDVAVETDSLTAYLRRIHQIPLLDSDREQLLLWQCQSDDPAARKAAVTELWESNLRLVPGLARPYHHYDGHESLAALIAEGNLGLWDAIRLFNPASGNRFSTYATWWVRQKIRRYANANKWLVDLPEYLIVRIRRAQRVRAELALAAGPDTDVPLEAVAAVLAAGGHPCTLEEVSVWLAYADGTLHGELSLERPLDGDESDTPLTLRDVLEDEEAAPDGADTLQQAALADWVRGLLHDKRVGLTAQERIVLRLRFGIGEAYELGAGDGVHKETGRRILEDCGKRLGVTRERVRQVEERALGKLQAACRRYTSLRAGARLWLQQDAG